MSVTNGGTYSLKVTAQNGCAATEKIIVAEKDCLNGVFIANAFTPNHDGHNDVFRAMVYGPVIKFSILIFNRYGQVVFSTDNHLKGWVTSDALYLDNFQKCQSLTCTNLFRPPYGRIKKTQIAAIRSTYPQMDVIMWDVLSGDFDLELSPDKCYKNVIKHAKNGSIIVFHDSLKASPRLYYALPKILEHFSALGYVFEQLPSIKLNS
ncbi:MAG: hypothetical protein EOO94_03515, partial [Pedobacter sp.]